MATGIDHLRGCYARRRALGVACAVLLLPALADADSMRCGSRVVKEEDTIEDVVAACGEPVKKERTWIQRQPRFELGGRDYSFPGTEDVPVDLWTFDLGRNQFLRQVRFIAGEVDSITTLEVRGR
jgi:Protein of unknown function (DUF2845)